MGADKCVLGDSQMWLLNWFDGVCGVHVRIKKIIAVSKCAHRDYHSKWNGCGGSLARIAESYFVCIRVRLYSIPSKSKNQSIVWIFGRYDACARCIPACWMLVNKRTDLLHTLDPDHVPGANVQSDWVSFSK